MSDVSTTVELVAQMTSTTGQIVDAGLPLLWWIMGIITAFCALAFISKAIKYMLKTTLK